MKRRVTITRWDKWFADDNLAQDERILAAPPTRSAEKAARAFLARGSRPVLDLACGVGRDSFHLASRGLDVVGADAAFNGLRVAQRIGADRGGAPPLVASDARRLPFQDGSFGAVYCFGLLHEFTGAGREADVAGVMAEVRRLLREGGLLVLTALAGEPEAGLPHVQLYTRGMFEQATRGWLAVKVARFDDVGCTGRPDYDVWYGVFEK